MQRRRVNRVSFVEVPKEMEQKILRTLVEVLKKMEQKTLCTLVEVMKKMEQNILCTLVGIVNKFLSFKGWIPLGRLTYCVYLLHPIIIRSISLYNETTIHLEFLPFVVLSMGYIVVSYFCAYVLFITVEIPCLLLMRTFIQNRSTNIIVKKVL
ncbi:uncharacterized protein LOC113006020 [Solenopsis invicta]|uniref:uncharacterized protein LOC113006020 n=1 Tax=Solenopsis invicta TaxID=13686 RepID=UPI00193E4751|nr:uncharacterized protein LOC113006020 [Solenopsis invicta]